MAAREVFDFLGVPQKIGIAWREGKHEQNIVDWLALLDFADWHFFGKEPGNSFTTLAFPESKKIYQWTKP